MKRAVLVLYVACLAVPAWGENALRVTDDGLKYWNRHFEIWGAQIPDWPELARTPSAVTEVLQPLCAQGVNTVGFALQVPGGSPFFSPEGDLADAKTGPLLTATVKLVRDHHLASVVGLFEANRACWLSSEQAYRQAAATVASLVGPKHSVVYVVGDIFGSGRWADDCPYKMNNPEKVLELCRLIKETHSEPLVAIPADVLKPRSAEEPELMFYMAAKIQPLEELVRRARLRPQRLDVPPGVIVQDASRFLCLNQINKADRLGLQRYLDQVEQRRMATHPKLPSTGPATSNNELTAQEQSEGFKSLFDGMTLRGWTTLKEDWATWSVKDGTIVCNGGDGQWLRTTKRYGSFVFRFEFRIARNGNSGVFVWSPLDGRSSRFGMEMQIRGLHKEKLDDDVTGAIYDVLPPCVDPTRAAGEWNTAEIACRGSKVTVNINGQVVQDIDADDVPKLRGRLRKGVIGLQDHGNEVAFRKLRIKELD